MSSRLLLPEAFGPTNTVSGSNSSSALPRGVVFRQVVGVEAGFFQPLYLVQPFPVNQVEGHTGNRLNVVEDSKLQCHE